MAKVTWIGEDSEGVAGPSFTTCFGMKFPKGEAVEVTDRDMVRRAAGNPFFSVEDDGKLDELQGLSILELRNMASASGIDHTGMSKSDLRDAIRAHDANVQDAN
jgi:hypothetical protein